MKNIVVFIAFTLAIGAMFPAKAQQKIEGDDFRAQTEMLNNDENLGEENRSIQVSNEEGLDKEDWSIQASKRWRSLIEDRMNTLKRELEN